MKIYPLLLSICIVAFGAENPKAAHIYPGEPFGEVLYDIIRSKAVPISHPLSKSIPKERTDVFKLQDNRILVINSISLKIGEPFSVKKILIGALGVPPNHFKQIFSFKLQYNDNSDDEF
jgi:hypothetical protein